MSSHTLETIFIWVGSQNPKDRGSPKRALQAELSAFLPLAMCTGSTRPSRCSCATNGRPSIGRMSWAWPSTRTSALGLRLTTVTSSSGMSTCWSPSWTSMPPRAPCPCRSRRYGYNIWVFQSLLGTLKASHTLLSAGDQNGSREQRGQGASWKERCVLEGLGTRG
jgi:hypothetical protein